MRKIGSVLFALVLMVVLAACGTADDAPAENTEEAGAGSGADTTEEVEAEDTSWADVEAAGKLVVGTQGTYAPITFYDENNELTGFDVELVRELGERLGLEVEFSTMDFDGILPALRNGQIDIAANDFSITEERKETFDFVIPHKYSYGSIIVRTEDVDNFESAHDLEGVKVALGSLTSNYAMFADNIGADGVAYDGGVEAILRDIINGNRDAYLNDRLVLHRTLKGFDDDRLAVAEQVKYHATESAIIMLKGNTSLKERLDEVMQELLEDGTVARISEEFLGEDVSQPVDTSEVIGLDGK
ncbi:transporter substrate-binding domain-containing protein [Alkalihalobacterium alkalinitrilicum]|uniref:transporter substrate-binding domain-containing protein n=1 Tax=Alkalihalobacterium alkalinitrilicum TaxID=427920 RepID=UPI0009959157|nr:transporter substrate-binding domain-containing protein [Alkalihalobacterium alkalinitrilicum]